MNIIVLWLLVTPLFFAFGWFAGRIDMKTVIKQAKSLPQRLFDSVDALIDNKTGIASDNLRDIIEQEPQLTELQLSLGKLYRNRGENDLAIKLHNKLLNSQYLFSGDEKDNVRLELARDFQHAGLIDRAESILLKLINSELYSHKAQDLLLDIYQQDKNWKDAIDTAKRLATSDYSYHTEVAQFNCELAQEALIKSDNEQALKFINYALEINRKCVRANLLLGEMYFAQENYNQAIETWQLIEKQNYLYLPMIVEKMLDAYMKLNKTKEGLTLIKGYATLYPKLNLCDFLYQKLALYDNADSALDYLKETIRVQPTSKIAAIMVDVYINRENFIPELRHEAEMVKNILLKYNEKLSNFRCGRCNFKSKTFFWQCPACYEWESINPNNSEN
ncbi:MAG: lipopolysaccharide assembly protein [Pseudomonadota bacterium]|nr:lipopolysaccharide assembly protein [Pseudomonadota bacterium]